MQFPARVSTRSPLLLSLIFMLTTMVGTPTAQATIVDDDWALELVDRIDPRGPGESTRVILDLLHRQLYPLYNLQPNLQMQQHSPTVGHC